MSIVPQIRAMLASGLSIEQALDAADGIERGARPKRVKLEPKPSDSALTLSALSRVLDESRASAVVAHRAKIKKPLTPHAAVLLAKAFGQTPDPNAAADMMILRGWQGFNPEWMSRSGNNAPPPARVQRTTFADIAHRFNDELEADRYDPGR